MNPSVTANIIPMGTFDPEDTSEEELREEIEDLIEMYKTTSLLDTFTVVISSPVTIVNGSHEVVVDEYSFVVTRRWSYGGDFYVGGAAGEALNVDEFARYILSPFQK